MFEGGSGESLFFVLFSGRFCISFAQVVHLLFTELVGKSNLVLTFILVLEPAIFREETKWVELCCKPFRTEFLPPELFSEQVSQGGRGQSDLSFALKQPFFPLLTN